MAEHLRFVSGDTRGLAAEGSMTGSLVGVVGAKSTCQVRVYQNGCQEKRSCRDCLNTALDDGLECYLDGTSGSCIAFANVSSTALNATASMTQNVSTRLQLLATNYEIFASTKQRYCSTNDGACTLCEAVADLKGYAPSSNQLKKMSTDRNICYGSNNCICVAKCEAQVWMDNAGKRCSSGSSLPSYNLPSADSDSTKSKMLLFIGLFAIFQFMILAFLVVRKRREINRRREANGPYNTAGILSDENRLQLPGWMAWQRELRDQEKHAPFVNLDTLRPSQSRHTLTATVSDASIVTQGLSSPPSTRHEVDRLST